MTGNWLTVIRDNILVSATLIQYVLYAIAADTFLSQNSPCPQRTFHSLPMYLAKYEIKISLMNVFNKKHENIN